MNPNRPFCKALLHGLIAVSSAIPLRYRQCDRLRAYQQGLAAYRAGRYREALVDLRPHARRGDPLAQLTLGNMYKNGLGVDKDVAQAARWYYKAAIQGDADAQFSLAVIYLSGSTVSPSKSEAIDWLTRAAAQGHRYARCVHRYVHGENRDTFQSF
jgi:TPR repeat protein